MDCIFCKIIAGEIPSDKVYEDEHVFAHSRSNICTSTCWVGTSSPKAWRNCGRTELNLKNNFAGGDIRLTAT